MITEVKWSD